MVEVNVSLTGALANVAEKATTVEADTLLQALTALTERYGEDFGQGCSTKTVSHVGSLTSMLMAGITGSSGALTPC